ncbi:MAG: LuxR C-terminal-related transcriptional regulator [Pseudomonadota bacterium]
MSGIFERGIPNQLALYLPKIAAGANSIKTQQEFAHWVGCHLRQLLTHETFVCGEIQFGHAGLRMRPLLRYSHELGPSEPCLWGVESRIMLTLATRWARSGTPQFLLESPTAPAGPRPADTAPSQLALPLVLHGMHDIGGRGASFFALCGIEADARASCSKILQLIGPHLHAALISLLRHQRHTRQASKTSTTTPVELNPGRHLSDREREVLNWLKEGKTNWEIAQILDISEKTVKNHVQKVLIKLSVNNRAQAVAKALAS